MLITKDNIFKEADKGNLEVLSSPLVGILKDCWGQTPLHFLAKEGKLVQGLFVARKKK